MSACAEDISEAFAFKNGKTRFVRSKADANLKRERVLFVSKSFLALMVWMSSSALPMCSDSKTTSLP